MRKVHKGKRVRVRIDGKERSFPSKIEAARAFGIPYQPFFARLRAGWTMRRALTTPLTNYKSRKYTPSADTIRYKVRQAFPITTTTH